MTIAGNQYRHRRGLTTGQIVLIVVVIVLGLIALTCVGSMIAGSFMMRGMVDTARVAAMGAKSTSQLQHIEVAIEQANQQNELTVRSLDDLVEHDFTEPDTLISEFGPLPDGGEDFWVDFDRPSLDEIDDPAMYLVSYDRGMYAAHHLIAACVLTTDCRLMSIEEFETLLAHPANADRDLELPARRDNVIDADAEGTGEESD